MVVVKAVRIISVLALILSAARAGHAQSVARPPRVFQGLFGPTAMEQTQRHRMDVTFSLYDAADDNLFLVSDTDVVDPTLQSGQWYTGATAALTYARRPKRTLLTLGAASAAYPSPPARRERATSARGLISGLDCAPVRTPPAIAALSPFADRG